jgi:hypothetical protein
MHFHNSRCCISRALLLQRYRAKILHTHHAEETIQHVQCLMKSKSIYCSAWEHGSEDDKNQGILTVQLALSAYMRSSPTHLSPV